MLCPDDVGHPLIVVFQRVRVGCLHLDHALHALGVGVLSPSDHRPHQHRVLHESEEPIHLPIGILIKEVLASNQSNSLENFHSKGLSGDGADHVHCVPLLPKEIAPNEENVPPFINVMVIIDASDEGVECILKILAHLLLKSRLFSHLCIQVLSLGRVGFFLQLSFLLQISSLYFLRFELFAQFGLASFEGLLRPGAEASGDRPPVPVEHSLSEESPLLVVLADYVKPFVEASRNLSAVHPDYEVAHNPVGLRLHFGHEMSLSTLVLLDLNLKMLNLLFVLHLSLIEFLNVLEVALLLLSAACLLPGTEARVRQLLVEGVGASQNELLRQFIALNVEAPRLIAVI
jgi:hypothetical protein